MRQVNLREIEEIYEVRLDLALYAIATLADPDATPEALAALHEMRESLHPAADSRKGEDLAERDASLDESLTALIGNETLIHELNSINERPLVFSMIDFGSADRIESACVQHRDILERIAAVDINGARTAIHTNVEDSQNIGQARFKVALARGYAAL